MVKLWARWRGELAFGSAVVTATDGTLIWGSGGAGNSSKMAEHLNRNSLVQGACGARAALYRGGTRAAPEGFW